LRPTDVSIEQAILLVWSLACAAVLKLRLMVTDC